MAIIESLGGNSKGTSPEEKNETTATHLKAAARHCLEAAKHFEAGDHERAALDILIAQRHIGLAHLEEEEEDINKSSESNYLYKQDNHFLFRKLSHEDNYFFTHKKEK